jgi:biopolymer transport protein ExbD
MKTMGMRHGWRTPSEDVDVPELNITPIMNMFVILIPFLVSMAVFTHLAVMNFSLPANAGVARGGRGEKPRMKLTVVVAPAFLALTKGEHLLDSLPAPSGQYDWAGLAEHLAVRRAAIEVHDEVIVAVRDAVAFKHVVRAMDRCREAGFVNIGLSTATERPDKGV